MSREGKARFRRAINYFVWEENLEDFLKWAKAVELPFFKIDAGVEVNISVGLDNLKPIQGDYIAFDKKLSLVLVLSPEEFGNHFRPLEKK